MLLRLNGQPLRAVLNELTGLIGGMEPGTSLTLDVLRDGRGQQLRVVLEATPPAAETASRYRKAADRGEAWRTRVSQDVLQRQRRVLRRGGGGPLVPQGGREGRRRVDVPRWVRAGKGSGVARDDAEAATWYRRAADRGHGPARNNLGALYRNGRGVGRDDAEAVKWYRLAAEQGVPVACDNLAFLYHHGYGVPKDSAEAVKWSAGRPMPASPADNITSASFTATGWACPRTRPRPSSGSVGRAEHNDVGPSSCLALCYQPEILGVAKDEAEAARWYREAADQGQAGCRGATSDSCTAAAWAW